MDATRSRPHSAFPPPGAALAAIGGTPLVRLRRLFPDARFRLFAKLEALNPGGSLKDRPARQIILGAIANGRVRPGTVVIESTSGNLGIGLAQACCSFGLPLICVVDAKTTRQNRAILHAYGAEVDVVDRPDGRTGEYLPARIRRVRELLAEHEDSFWPNQYANPDNPLAHHGTMDEIVSALAGRLDYLFCATSTCGTLRGCAEYARHAGLRTRIVAVDAAGSVIFGTARSPRLLPGHGAAVRPGLHRADLADRVIHVTDRDCVTGCRRLVQAEALLTGGSSGAVVMAVERMRDQIADGATCVVILPDRGERYLDTIYSDDWVAANL